MATAASADPDSAQLAYEQKKARLIDQLKNNKQTDTISLKKNTSNLFRNRKQTSKKIDVREFNKIIKVDPINLIAEIEGMATYEDIVDVTLKYNCLPPVVPELKSITIGGALAGCGIEASSFRYGLTPETILEFEVLLGDGRVITCSPNNEHKDLFYAFPNTYGTLGYALKVKIKLIPVKKYVKLTNLHVHDPTQYFSRLEEYCLANRHTGPIDYIDGVIFNQNERIIILGSMVDDVPYISNYKYLNIYYRSLQIKDTDYLTIKDYIWRWDPDWFWCSKHFYMQKFWLRLLLGKWLLKSTVYWKIRRFFNSNLFALKLLEKSRGRTESVIQDVQIPVQNAESFLEFFQEKIAIKPIWICPTQRYRSDVQFDFYPMDPHVLYINFGFWDAVKLPSSILQGEAYYNPLIENKVAELNGKKSLYAAVYYSKDKFWEIFDKQLYEQLKQKYDPQHRLRDLYDKAVEK
jgi:FAD/FMN-containing dehydrogenase